MKYGKMHLIKNLSAVVLSISMLISLPGVSVRAASENAPVSTESASASGNETVADSGTGNTGGTGNTAAGNSSQNPAADTDTGDSSISSSSAGGQADREDSKTSSSDQTEAEADFEETGTFGATVTDTNGTTVKAWQQDSDGYWYLFLPNNVSIPDLEVNITGIRMAKTSSGNLDTKTNRLTNAFASDGDGVTLTAKNGSKYNLIVRQSGLPSLSLTLNGTSLVQLNSGSKDTKYSGNSAILTDSAGDVDLEQSDVEIKGRGNTTWYLPDKKSYQIKFSKKQSVLGMAKAKKWVLLANAFDDSMVRNTVAFHLSESLGLNWTPEYQYVELWVNGEYLGTYLLGEKVEIDSNRLNLTDDSGVLVEQDSAWYEEEDHYFYDSERKRYYSLKESVNEDDTSAEASLELFQEKLDRFLDYVFNTSPSDITMDGLSQYADIDSVAKWYLTEEYLSNLESFTTSWYWYTDGADDVIHMGPVWDFDSCMGNYPSNMEYDAMYGKNNCDLFIRLMKVPEFVKYVKNLYTQNKDTFASLSAYAETIANSISSSAGQNYIRWAVLGTASPKGLKPYASTYSEAVSNLVEWLDGRYANFNIESAKTKDPSYSIVVSDDGHSMTVKAENVTDTTSIRTAVWNKTNGQDDLKWYNLKKQSDGSYSVTVDLTKHGSSDTYYAHIYVGSSTCLAALSENVVMPNPEISAAYDEATGNITGNIKNAAGYQSVKVAVWSTENDQDDLKWYTVTMNTDGSGTFSVNTQSHTGTGTYCLHAYGIKNSTSRFLALTTVDVTALIQPEITAAKEENSNTANISVKNVSSYSNLQAAVWGNKDDQNDLKWYSMQQDSSKNWSVDIDLLKHKETGTYNIHIYGVVGGKKKYIGSTTLTVKELKGPELSVKTVEEGTSYTAILYNDADLTSLRFAVWGEEKDQNDLHWYTASKRDDGTWTCTIRLINHGETGKYNVHAYGVKNGKQSLQAMTQFSVETLNIPTIKSDVSASGKILRATLENPGNYSSVTMAVWSVSNGQDDLKWHKAYKNQDGTWSIVAALSDHEPGEIYNIHAYGVTDGTNSCVSINTFTTPDTGSETSEPVMTIADRNNGFSVTITNAEEYDSMQVAVWTTEQNQDDLKWYHVYQFSDGSWRIYIDARDHGGNGTYCVHAYGIKNGSTKKQYVCGSTFEESIFGPATIKATLSGTKLTIMVNCISAYSGLRIAVWGEENDQNDLKWYTFTKTTGENHSVTIDLAGHKETGRFQIHCYGSCAKANYFLGSTSVILNAS